MDHTLTTDDILKEMKFEDEEDNVGENVAVDSDHDKEENTSSGDSIDLLSSEESDQEENIPADDVQGICTKESGVRPNIIYLPNETLEQIFRFLSFDEVAKYRIVCKKFDKFGSAFLTKGFLQIDKRHAVFYNRVKSALPRRQSERRDHPLYPHYEILSSVDTHLRTFQMTYFGNTMKKMWHFIPGKALDEIKRILNIVETKHKLPENNEILLELRDMFIMAVEHFDEKILPGIKAQKKSVRRLARQRFKERSQTEVYFMHPGLQKEIEKLTKSNEEQNAALLSLSCTVQKLYNRTEKQEEIIKSHINTISTYDSTIPELQNKLKEHESTINELKKQVGYFDNKFVQLLSDVIHSKEDMQLPRGTHNETINSRLSQVQTPNTSITELEKKRKASIDSNIPIKQRFKNPRDSTSMEINERISTKFYENITLNLSQRILREDYNGETRMKRINISNDPILKGFTSHSFQYKNMHDIDNINELKNYFKNMQK